MYTLKYEYYKNDSNRRHEEKSFCSLSEMKEWIHNSTIEDSYYKCFPTKEHSHGLMFKTKNDEVDLWIHEIDSNKGILFTDGDYTGNIRHLSDSLVDWMANIRKRNYNFI